MPLVIQPLAGVLLTIFVLLGAVTVVLARLPLTRIEAAFGKGYRALTALYSDFESAYVCVTAGVDLLTLAVLLTSLELTFIRIATLVRFFSFAIFEIVFVFAFKYEPVHSDFSPAAMPLASDPHTVIVGAVSTGESAEALAAPRLLVHLSLVLAAVSVPHQWSILEVDADVVRAGKIFGRVLRIVLLVRWRERRRERLVVWHLHQ